MLQIYKTELQKPGGMSQSPKDGILLQGCKDDRHLASPHCLWQSHAALLSVASALEKGFEVMYTKTDKGYLREISSSRLWNLRAAHENPFSLVKSGAVPAFQTVAYGYLSSSIRVSTATRAQSGIGSAPP